MEWIAFVGALVCEKWLWKECQKVLYFYKEEENRQALKKNKKDLSCGFVAVINAVLSRDWESESLKLAWHTKVQMHWANLEK